MCFITGNNLFGQWCLNMPTYDKFTEIDIHKTYSIPNKSLITFIQINWSYNIYKLENAFYVSGAWQGKEHQFVKIPFFEKVTSYKAEELLIIGNDYKLILMHRHSPRLWVLEFEKLHSIKEICFSETPIENSQQEYSVTKTIATNNSFMCLTSTGRIYIGLPPCMVDTSHCIGTVCDIQCGYEHFVLLTDAGRVYTWGSGRRLQLGHGDLDNLDFPTEVEGLAGLKITKVSAGGWHSAALSEFGDLYVWGWNDTGQLGVRSTNDTTKEEDLNSCGLPTLVDIYDDNGEEVSINIRDIACGSRHTAILLNDNTVWTTGCNKYGQLGFSKELYPMVKYFRKSFKSDSHVELICGPWSTLLKK